MTWGTTMAVTSIRLINRGYGEAGNRLKRSFMRETSDARYRKTQVSTRELKTLGETLRNE